jgi:hypothetical protein
VVPILDRPAPRNDGVDPCTVALREGSEETIDRKINQTKPNVQEIQGVFDSAEPVLP